MIKKVREWSVWIIRNIYTVLLESLWTTCRICENVNNFNKRDHTNACHFLLSTVLSKIFYINNVYIKSTRQKKNSWIYKYDPIQKFINPWFLILCVITWMIHECFLFCDDCSESLVCPEQLNCPMFFKKKFFSFPASFVYLNHFQQWLYDFEIHLFTLMTTKGLKHNYWKRFKHSLMLQKETGCIKSRGVKTFWIWRSKNIVLNLSSGKHLSVFCCFWRAVLNEKKNK